MTRDVQDAPVFSYVMHDTGVSDMILRMIGDRKSRDKKKFQAQVVSAAEGIFKTKAFERAFLKEFSDSTGLTGVEVARVVLPRSRADVLRRRIACKRERSKQRS